MASPRDIRRLAFQALFQLDVRGEPEGAEIRSTLDDLALDDAADFSPGEIAKAFTFAQEAFADRRSADEAMARLAPTWPAHRQPAVDRAILRLAHFEMTSGRTSPKIAVNEAVELAKKFSTDRSPAFINGLLDKVLKEVLAQTRGAGEAGEAAEGEPTSTEPGA